MGSGQETGPVSPLLDHNRFGPLRVTSVHFSDMPRLGRPSTMLLPHRATSEHEQAQLFKWIRRGAGMMAWRG